MSPLDCLFLCVVGVASVARAVIEKNLDFWVCASCGKVSNIVERK
jgi:hypothetical protein